MFRHFFSTADNATVHVFLCFSSLGNDGLPLLRNGLQTFIIDTEIHFQNIFYPINWSVHVKFYNIVPVSILSLNKLTNRVDTKNDFFYFAKYEINTKLAKFREISQTEFFCCCPILFEMWPGSSSQSWPSFACPLVTVARFCVFWFDLKRDPDLVLNSCEISYREISYPPYNNQ
jgi:hypothetical protein